MYFQALLVFLASTASAHFVLNTPTSVGFDEDKSTQGPCGSFDVKNRTTVTQWPVNGGELAILSVDNAINATVNFAMAGNTTMFTPGIKFNMVGTGDLCLPAVKPPASMQNMVGMQAVLQVRGNTADGVVFQVGRRHLDSPSRFSFRPCMLMGVSSAPPLCLRPPFRLRPCPPTARTPRV
jgi:hypothetical protein